MNTSVNIVKILKDALAGVLARKHYLIISAIEIPNGRKKILKRVCYYIKPSERVPNKFLVFKYVFDIYPNPVDDEIAKYEIVSNWETADYAQKFNINRSRPTNPDYFNKILKFFIEKNIDTVCTIDRNTNDFIDILYDHTGKAHITKQFIQNARYLSNERLTAQREGDPSVFFDTPEQQEILKQLGYNPASTQQPEQKEILAQIENIPASTQQPEQQEILAQLGNTPASTQQPEQKEILTQMAITPAKRKQYVAKRKPKRKNDELNKINRLIAQINKVL